MFKVCIDPKPKLSSDSEIYDTSKQVKLEFDTTNAISSYSLITSKETPRRNNLDSTKVKMVIKHETSSDVRRPVTASTSLNTTKKLGRFSSASNDGFKEVYEINKVIKQNKNKKNSWTKKEVNFITYMYLFILLG